MNDHDLRVKSIDTALEWTKQIITLSAGILVVSGTFIKEVFGNQVIAQGSLTTSWIALCVCIVFGILFMGSLCSIYANSKAPEVRLYSQPAQTLGIIHFLAFIIATISFAIFALRNLGRDPISGANAASEAQITPVHDNANSCLETLGSLFVSGLNFVGTITGLVALIIAVLALSSQRRHNRLSVQPCFAFEPKVDNHNFIFSWTITNFGNGPAIVEGVDVTVNAQRHIAPTFNQVVQLLGLGDAAIGGSMLRPGDLFGAGRSYVLLSVNALQQIPPAARGVVWHIRYKTTYEETGEFSTEQLPA